MYQSSSLVQLIPEVLLSKGVRPVSRSSFLVPPSTENKCTFWFSGLVYLLDSTSYVLRGFRYPTFRPEQTFRFKEPLQVTTVGIPTMYIVQHSNLISQLKVASERGFRPSFSVKCL